MWHGRNENLTALLVAPTTLRKVPLANFVETSENDTRVIRPAWSKLLGDHQTNDKSIELRTSTQLNGAMTGTTVASLANEDIHA